MWRKDEGGWQRPTLWVCSSWISTCNIKKILLNSVKNSWIIKQMKLYSLLLLVYTVHSIEIGRWETSTLEQKWKFCQGNGSSFRTVSSISKRTDTLPETSDDAGLVVEVFPDIFIPMNRLKVRNYKHFSIHVCRPPLQCVNFPLQN